MTNDRIEELRAAGLLPISGQAVTFRDRMRQLERTQRVYEYNPYAVDIVALARSRMYDVIIGGAPDVRCHHDERYRRMQLDCTASLPDVELAEIALENDLGLRGVLAYLAVFLLALGRRHVPVDERSTEPQGLLLTAAWLHRTNGELQALINEAQAKGYITLQENKSIQKMKAKMIEQAQMLGTVADTLASRAAKA